MNLRGSTVASGGREDSGMYERVPCFSRLLSSAFHDSSHRWESGVRRAARRERGLVAVSP